MLSPKIKQHAVLIILGLFAGFILLEFGLRLSGLIYRSYSSKDIAWHENQNQDPVVKILCLGDSFTFGVGAPKALSYPRQLGALLEKDFGHRVKVINNSVAGMNSSEVFKYLPNQLAAYKPHIIVLLIGANDFWNFKESNIHLYTANILKRSLLKLDSYFICSRVYKLLRIWVENLNLKIVMLRLRSKHKLDNSSFNCEIMKKHLSPDERVEKAKLLRDLKQNAWRQGDSDAVRLKVHKILDIDPYDYELLFHLASMYRLLGNLEDSEFCFKKGLDINPCNLKRHKELFEVLMVQRKYSEAIEQAEMLLLLDPFNPYWRRVHSLSLKGIEPGLIMKMKLDNFNKICRLTEAEGVQLVLQNYPGEIDNEIFEYFKDSGMPFVDNKEVFNALSQNKDYMVEDYYAPDGHLNERGYGIMAENVYLVIKPAIKKLLYE
jgi:lysophospholipase L1-like esterase